MNPELGQLVFGRGHFEYSVDTRLELAISVIHRLFSSADDWNPFYGSEAFRCSTFGVWAYDWGDRPQPYNFRVPSMDISVCWYKYFGRSMSCNRIVQDTEIATLVKICTKAALECLNNEMECIRGGVWEVPYYD